MAKLIRSFFAAYRAVTEFSLVSSTPRRAIYEETYSSNTSSLLENLRLEKSIASLDLCCAIA